MTAKEIQKRNIKAESLKVLQSEDGKFFVESEKGKVLYNVVLGDDGNTRGLFPCFQPGSLVRYLKKDILEFEKKNTSNRKGGDKRTNVIKREMPVVSPIKDENWRI